MSTSLQLVSTLVAPSVSNPPVTAAAGGVGEGVHQALLRPVWDPHTVAAVGIIALAVLGGVLVARNRIAEASTIPNDAELQHHEEFLTDQERVCQLLDKHGGRMKQSKIVNSVDWSKAKVSRLLAELEEEGEVTKLRLGRENLVCLPGHEPTASKSPEQPKHEP
jgi:uncharacterized membrane protein